VKLLFMGTASFAVPSLLACAARHHVVAVVTQPPRPGSRGAPAARPVGDEAARLGIPVRTPARVRDPAAVAELAALGADAIVVAAYGQILPQSLLDAPPFGSLNVHASLLPRWRGAAPVAHAILAGDRQTGVCIMRMDAGLDTGPVYRCESMSIAPDATTPELSAALAQLGARLLVEVLEAVQRGEITPSRQALHGVTIAPRLRREDGRLRWEDAGGEVVDRYVRALQPWPGVSMPLAGREVRILEGAAEPMPDGVTAAPGAVLEVTRDSVLVAARGSAYRVRRVLPPGSRAMDAAAYLRGRRSAPS
jgi:methionyl-tRNA formyltransferase